MHDDKKQRMVEFWSERAKQYGADPRANTNDIWLREIEINYIDAAIKECAPSDVLDFGCANGFTSARLARLNPAAKITGIDINADMIAIGKKDARDNKIDTLDFQCIDLLSADLCRTFDFIFAVRVFQNIQSPELQKKAADVLAGLLRPGGTLLYIESYVDGYKRLNDDRVAVGLPALPIHPHLTLLTDAFDEHVGGKLKFVRRDAVSSSYYYSTRLLYSQIARLSGEAIDYNHPIHQVAAQLPQIGDYGPQRACVFRKA
jgi:SAM-dependent methyltransferase